MPIPTQSEGKQKYWQTCPQTYKQRQRTAHHLAVGCSFRCPLKYLWGATKVIEQGGSTLEGSSVPTSMAHYDRSVRETITKVDPRHPRVGLYAREWFLRAKLISGMGWDFVVAQYPDFRSNLASAGDPSVYKQPNHRHLCDLVRRATASQRFPGKQRVV